MTPSQRSYFPVSPRFWTDPDMLRCSDDAKLLALYLLTGPHRRTEGLFRLPKPYICADLGWTLERLAEPFRELLGPAGFLAYDDQAQVVLIRNALKYQAPQNPNQVKAVLKHLGDLPDTPLTCEFRQLAERYCEDLAKALPKGFGEPIPEPPSPTPPQAQDQHHRRASSTDDDPTQAVFDAWRESTGKAKAQLDDKRLRRIKAALRAYPLADVLDAVRGWANSPHHRGENDQGTVYNELTLLLRDAEHIERFRDFWRAGPANGPPGKATLRMVRTAQRMQGWAQRMEGGEGDPARVDPDRGQAQRELPGPAG